MISVVGGCYAELCLVPSWNHIYGSAGRAAAAISCRCPVELHTLLSVEFEKDFLFSMALFDVTHRFVSQNCSISFEYLHPLASPTSFEDGERSPTGTLPHVRSENILSFGMIEYIPAVHGHRVIYDPQGSSTTFSQTGSTAKELVYVLNEFELKKITDTEDLREAGTFLLQRENAVAVVVKRGPLGVMIFVPGENVKIVPCYRARRVFKIGSGDIFAAAFAYFWMIGEETIEAAADLASRATACYVETQDAFIPEKEELLRDYADSVSPTPGRVYLAAPFFCLEQRWLLEETKSLLEHLGCSVFSPLHEVGTGKPNNVLASEDLVGLDDCDAILALMNDNDTGTIFEVGYAKANSKNVVAYAEKNNARDLTMLDGTACLVFPDYCSAIYNAVWESCQR
jgi:hypothetical protein